MMGARGRALALVVILLIGIGALAFARMAPGPRPLAERPAADRPTLLLLTSLPLIFNEDFSLQGGGSPALRRLETRYRVVPISVTDSGELAKGGLLIMAHPRAQTAENLVALDAWIRRGGHLLLLADPMLEWPSSRRLGDPLRPAPMFMDTGLLAHWGLRLDAPDVRGPVERKLGGYAVTAVSPGTLHGSCAVQADRLVAHCRIGRGKATIVADADVLNPVGIQGRHNLDGVLAELAALESAIRR